jgi:hypothetical protein
MKRTLLPVATLLTLAACTSSKELTCASDQKVCSNACVSLQSDAKNCGSCGNVCGAGQGCSAGACVDCATHPAACATAVVAACFNLGQVRPLGADLSPAGPPITTDSGPSSFATLAGKLYVANDLASSISAVTIVPPAATTGSAALQVPSQGVAFPDVGHVTAHGSLLWVSNSGTGTLVALDPSKPPANAVVREIPLTTTGEYVNPHAVDFVGDVAYVALAGVGAVAVVDTAAATLPQPPPRIDVSGYATGTATASPDHVLATGGKVYVTLNDIIDASYKQVAGANGKLVVIDPTTNTVIGGAALDLGPDCLDAGPMALSGTTLWIGCGYYDFTSVHAAGLMPVSIAGATPVAGQVAKTTSGIGALAVCDGRGYAGAIESGTILAFDTVTGAVSATADACPPSAPGKGTYVADVACAP